jgi:hypothetical protein
MFDDLASSEMRVARIGTSPISRENLVDDIQMARLDLRLQQLRVEMAGVRADQQAAHIAKLERELRQLPGPNDSPEAQPI